MERSLSNFFHGVGRPPRDRAPIARAFVVKAVYNIPTTRMLIERLESDLSLCRICGWERRSQLPNESTFSRAFAEFANSELPQITHDATIKMVFEGRVVMHVSRDSTAIIGREKPVKKEKKKSSKKQGRPKEAKRLDKQMNMNQKERLDDLPKSCDVGAKTNSKGNKEFWVRFKLHIDTADGDIPLSVLLTSASLHDSQAAIPLAVETADKVTSFYDLMDSAYDAPQISKHSEELGHIAIIDKNARSRAVKTESENEAKARRMINWKSPEEVRYNQRSSAERVNSRLKDDFGGRMVRVRGHAKVACHLMFGILALTADAMLNLVR